MAVNFNKRVFGAGIDPEVKKKLNARQEVFQGQGDTNALIYKEVLNTTELNAGFEGSSRTTFARMWTVVERLPRISNNVISKLRGELKNFEEKLDESKNSYEIILDKTTKSIEKFIEDADINIEKNIQ